MLSAVRVSRQQQKLRPEDTELVDHEEMRIVHRGDEDVRMAIGDVAAWAEAQGPGGDCVLCCLLRDLEVFFCLGLCEKGPADAELELWLVSAIGGESSFGLTVNPSSVSWTTVEGP
jgi:hypothetical protein